MRDRKSFIRITCIILVVLMLLSLLTVVFSSGAYADSSSIAAELNSLRSQKSEIQAKMDELQGQIDDVSFEKANVVEKKEILDQKNLLAQEELDVIEEQIDIVDGLIENMQADLDEAVAEEEYQKERWLTRVRAMEEGSTLSYIEVLFNATSFSDLLTRLDLINEVIEYDRDLEEDYIAARENVETLEAEAEVKFTENEANKAELETKKAQLEADIEAACQLIAEMEATLEGYNELMAEEQTAEADVSAQIAAKEVEYANAVAAEQAAAAAAAAAAAQSYSSGGSVYISDSGSMLWPSYCTTISSYYGYRVHPVYGTYKYHSGVDIAASGGSAIWAAADGIAYTYTNSGYGNYVVIQHYDGKYTLYGHMSSWAVSNGQAVSQGQVIGYCGTTGVSTGYHIHFEVWNSSKANTDPLGYGYIYG